MTSYVYHYDNSKSLVSQAIKKFNDIYLLNVRKTYTDGKYFGVYFTTFSKEKGIEHIFKCKDRCKKVFSKPELIDDKQELLKNFYHYLIDGEGAQSEISFSSNVSLVQQNIKLPFEVSFAYDNYDNYKFTFINGGSFELRDFYEKQPSKEEIISFIESTKNKFSNNEITVNTTYSFIKVETNDQYKKRRENDA